MGVKGLYSFACKLREQFQYDILDKDTLEDYEYRHFILDGISWLWNTMEGNALMDFYSLRKKARNLVRAFKQCGFKLIVFIDANVTTNKLNQWMERRARRVANLWTINERLKQSECFVPDRRTTHPNGFDRLWFASTGCYFFCGQVFESLGCKVVFAHIDSDREMYGYFKLNHSAEGIVGVIGFDSDFLIFDIPIYLELTSMRSHRRGLSFLGHHHHKLMRSLHCKQHHLPRIATLLGCDVVQSHPAIRGDVHSAAIMAQSYDDGDAADCSSISKRFRIGDVFYSGVAPLDILPHPFLIMLLFQDYNQQSDCCQIATGTAPKHKKKQKAKGGKDSTIIHLKGVIVDLAMDDLSLRQQKESSALITQRLRKWLYARLLADDETHGSAHVGDHEAKLENLSDSEVSDSKHGEDGGTTIGTLWKEQRFRMRETICWPSNKFCFNEDLAQKEWRKGVDVDLFGRKSSRKKMKEEEDEESEDNENPLLNLESYRFVKDLIETKENGDLDGDSDRNERLRIKVPAGCLVLDIVYLLNYLRGNKGRRKDTVTANEKVEEQKLTEHPFAFGTDGLKIEDFKVSSTSEHGVDAKDQKEESTKKGGWIQSKSKRSRRRRKTQKEKKKERKRRKKRNVDRSVWSDFSDFVAAFLYQWEYRDIFVDQNGAHLVKPMKGDETRGNKRSDFYLEDEVMSNRSMHFRSIIFGLYEVIYAFLQIEFGVKWFKPYFRDFVLWSFKRNSNFIKIPRMRLPEGVQCAFIDDGDVDCECKLCRIRDGIEEFKENLQDAYGDVDGVAIDLRVPFVWDVINTPLFHWMCRYPLKTKQWINDCIPGELL